jgi:glycogen phosphorylase
MKTLPMYGGWEREFSPVETEGFNALAELALDMRWSWNHATDEIWRKLDPELWETAHNPWVVLQTVSRDRIQQAMDDPVFRANVDGLAREWRRTMEAPAWFQTAHPRTDLTCVAYFSMEFMLSEALPIYSGGLGNVAGDQLKAASDLGLPVVGVGLLYQQGYFRQEIGKDGEQQALFPYNDPGQLPITPVRKLSGEWLRLEIALPGYSVWLRAWQAQVGRVKLYLLDSNDAANIPVNRGITSELYGGGPELRLKQEILLGMGGWRLLSELGIRPEVCHLNEGHAAFAVLERARGLMLESSLAFDAALASTRAGNLFTTHTAVAAGFDRFDPALIERYLRRYAVETLGIPIRDLLALGRRDPDDASEPFNMAYLAIRGSGAVNAVSRLHGKVSRELFNPLFPRWPENDVPVGHVTNGVHMPTWDSAQADELWTDACGKGRWLGTMKDPGQCIRGVSDAKLWRFRAAAAESLVDFARERLSLQLESSGASSYEIEGAKRIFDPKVLTLGFSRRFASYKRPNLLLSDPERLTRILTNADRPAQLVIAGKAHPDDREGQALIHEWIRFIRRPENRSRVIFLSDDDMLLTERLVQGVDVWINTPRRPWEACGTSGMKVLVNGGVNLSELDGWWAEAYAPEVGWALGDGREHGDDPGHDAEEAEALYRLLENGVIPEFYDRDGNGIPAAWLRRMRESMARLTPFFSADRTVREYAERYYLPAAKAYLARAAENGAEGGRIADWLRETDRSWAGLRFGGQRVETKEGRHVFEIDMFLNGFDEGSLRVELYADGIGDGAPLREEMRYLRESEDKAGGRIYGAAVPASRPVADFTVRAISRRDGMSVPLECSRILWNR